MRFNLSVIPLGLLLSFSLLFSCGKSEENAEDANVKMRPLTEASKALKVNLRFVPEPGNEEGSAEKTTQKRKNTKISSSDVKSEIYCPKKNGPCDCIPGKVRFSQLFLKHKDKDITDGTHTSLMKDDEVVKEGGKHNFIKDTVIGVDVHYELTKAEYDAYTDGEKSELNGKYYKYISSGDHAFFNDDFPWDAEKKEEVYGGTGAFTFPVGNTPQAPDVSTTGCWIDVVVDFPEEG